MTLKNSELTIGQMAKRTGLAVSAIRYYETEGLITANRNRGGHRRFARAQVRRVSFILIAQKFNLTLPQIKEVLRQLPDGRTPNAKDWAGILINKLLIWSACVTVSMAASVAAVSRSMPARFTIRTTGSLHTDPALLSL